MIISKDEIILTDEDKRLLSQALPVNPCESCSINTRIACCGCPEETKYTEAIKKYKNAGILEYAKISQSIQTIDHQIKKLNYNKEQLYALLPNEIKEFLYNGNSNTMESKIPSNQTYPQIKVILKHGTEIKEFEPAVNTLLADGWILKEITKTNGVAGQAELYALLEKV